LKDRWVLIGAGLIASALAATILFPFFFPHYFAAYTCVIVFLVVRGMAWLYRWEFRGRAIGSVVAVFLMSGGLIMATRIAPVKSLLGLPSPVQTLSFRSQAEERLKRLEGQQVVFVRYGANHSFHDEWVYNGANIDSAKVIWCRATDPADEAEVTRYYQGRHFWMADVDKDTARLSRYESSEGWEWRNP
jgi:hypothetical protein